MLLWRGSVLAYEEAEEVLVNMGKTRLQHNKTITELSWDTSHCWTAHRTTECNAIKVQQTERARRIRGWGINQKCFPEETHTQIIAKTSTSLNARGHGLGVKFGKCRITAAWEELSSTPYLAQHHCAIQEGSQLCCGLDLGDAGGMPPLNELPLCWATVIC